MNGPSTHAPHVRATDGIPPYIAPAQNIEDSNGASVAPAGRSLRSSLDASIQYIENMADSLLERVCVCVCVCVCVTVFESCARVHMCSLTALWQYLDGAACMTVRTVTISI